jgi:hypothetical protein
MTRKDFLTAGCSSDDLLPMNHWPFGDRRRPLEGRRLT